MQERKSRHPGLTVVQVAYGIDRGKVIKASLESAGIPALLDYESMGPILGILADGLAEVRILVHDEDVEDALNLLEELSWDEDFGEAGEV